ncbi:hypothetical protein U6G28_02555 [Actinomycetaceae bacterium MB13-C1-2]|nr:hypothetical protein U6G28_02555 [Actinomycetaceae bacterium MB13-C1-2]
MNHETIARVGLLFALTNWETRERLRRMEEDTLMVNDQMVNRHGKQVVLRLR